MSLHAKILSLMIGIIGAVVVFHLSGDLGAPLLPFVYTALFLFFVDQYIQKGKPLPWQRKK